MPRHIQNSTSSSCFNPKEPGPDESPASNNARPPTRARKLRKRLRPLEVPNNTNEPRISPVEQGTVVEVYTERSEEVSANVLWLVRMETLPPLSPEGRQFATRMREESFRYADVAGEWLFQLLQDNLPGYEKLAGEDKARHVRDNIEKLHRGDPKEIRKILSMGFQYEPASKWSDYEKSKVSRYPMALATTGVAKVIPIAQDASARGGSECHSSPEVSRVPKCSPESSCAHEKTGCSTDCGADSPDCLSTSDISDYQSSDYDSEEDGSASEDKVPYEMFPYRRYREDF